jgi:hypothetical protein
MCRPTGELVAAVVSPAVPRGTHISLNRKGTALVVALVNLGLIATAIAKPMPGDGPGVFLVMVMSGIVGALLGGFLAGGSSDLDPLDEVLRQLHLDDGDRRNEKSRRSTRR